VQPISQPTSIQQRADVSKAAKRFDSYRALGPTAQRPLLWRGGWHLTSFGTGDELLRKLRTIGASALFDPTRTGHAATLNLQRLHASVATAHTLTPHSTHRQCSAVHAIPRHCIHGGSSPMPSALT
jgi:hypothetical protein